MTRDFWVVAGLFFFSAFLVSGCGDSKSVSSPPSSSGTSTPTPPANHHSGSVIDLGAATLGNFKIRVTRDNGLVTPGGEVPVDVFVDEGRQNVRALRFWVGIESAEGSVKVLSPMQGEHWHTHAEVPRVLPAGAQLWVEIEDPKGDIVRSSFDLKMS